ncbi:hypothetical protein PI95_034515 [Hassallia byssoidea VB512170]|jgi:hypothetical protein|uniref:Uncharacterized protein n=1 Tax=Hassallia byssoidea VB512170 TaxID=1304833 RepID=A0A846HIY7_9CYAN|nr:hypothetical protein [Hassalia byssoidea]MBW4569783.1 hypothetical protein [Tolypothrix carrinoi HA7290-LM1]NEU77437.1 hypothetical protein [Hassalia byssoidea VB512170]
MKVRKVIELEVPGLGDRVRQARIADNRSHSRDLPSDTYDYDESPHE